MKSLLDDRGSITTLSHLLQSIIDDSWEEGEITAERVFLGCSYDLLVGVKKFQC